MRTPFKVTYRVIPEGIIEFNLNPTFIPTFISTKQEDTVMYIF